MSAFRQLGGSHIFTICSMKYYALSNKCFIERNGIFLAKQQGPHFNTKFLLLIEIFRSNYKDFYTFRGIKKKCECFHTKVYWLNATRIPTSSYIQCALRFSLGPKAYIGVSDAHLIRSYSWYYWYFVLHGLTLQRTNKGEEREGDMHESQLCYTYAIVFTTINLSQLDSKEYG